ncbi:hypothetical protein P3X46_023611 [Hevea brasiliensis]|uniref:Pectinesterase n=1 Tax=Hevea brasiliensis TaxID=3981 RepID=A0ABQ9LFA3_HEVBR|nr:pectinesterase PPME1-like [Hevea brasiliensis]KAJ9163993.1 hypothetical protein P3X46_023611 [Hevea brasiliensis]
MARYLPLISFKYAILAILLAAITVSSDDNTPIPESESGIQAWFNANVKPLASRKGTLNSSLEAAEANPKIIKVRQNGGGDFKTITDAVKSIPSGNKQRVILDIGAGTYNEKVIIPRDKPFVSFIGQPNSMPTLQYGGTAAQYGTVFSATLQVESDFFVASNMIFKNTAPKPDGKRKGAQALALRTGGSMAALYNVKMYGFQDTLCDDRGYHFFKDCYIEGTVDFIFGSGKSIYLNTELRVLAANELTVITAHARQKDSEDIGFSFVHCQVTGNAGNGKKALLGRAWMEMPRVVFAYSSMSEVVDPKGWSSNDHPEREGKVFFGEYKNTGPGAAPSGRVKYSKQLSAGDVKPYTTLGFIKGSSWLLPPPKL